MLRSRAGLVFWLMPISVLAPAAGAAIRMNYFEGQTILDGLPLQNNKGAALTSGDILQTQSGRAELLLAPDFYLRLGEQSSVRIVSDAGAAPEVELMAGAIVVDSAGASGEASLAVRAGDSVTRIAMPGEYRFDAEPPRLRVDRGEAQVERGGHTAFAGSSQTFSLGPAAAPGTALTPPDPLLDVWSANRRIHLSTSFAAAPFAGAASSSGPLLEQPEAASDEELSEGPSATLDYLFLTGIPELMYIPQHPYRIGRGFYPAGPAIGYPYGYPYGNPEPPRLLAPRIPPSGGPYTIPSPGVPHQHYVVGH